MLTLDSTYHVGNRSFIVEPVFKEESSQTLGEVLLRLMKSKAKNYNDLSGGSGQRESQIVFIIQVGKVNLLFDCPKKRSEYETVE